jgi:hypothetical protein
VTDRDRRDRLARAVAAIVTVADLVPDDLPPLLSEAIDKGRAALAERDKDFAANVVVVGETSAEAADWARSNQVDDGARVTPMTSRRELVLYNPVTIIILPGADRADDWPRTWAAIAALGDRADVIRLNAQPLDFRLQYDQNLA